MESSTGATAAPVSSGPGLSPAAAGPSAAAQETEELRIGKRLWRVRTADARMLPKCSVCLYSLAQSTLCRQLQHAVCPECRPRILASAQACVQCRLPFEDEPARDIQDRSLRQMQQPLLESVMVDCMACNSWSGPITEVDRHRAVCSEALSPCSWPGCEWTGLDDKLEAHAAQCGWQPVSCALSGCGTRIPLCQKDDHEAVCDYRPARLGALVTDARTLQQIDSLCQWRWKGAALTRAEVDETQLWEEVLPAMVRCLSLVAGSVRTAVPAGSRHSLATCAWDCGFRTTMERLEAHYAHCPRMPVKCSWCPQQLPRSELHEHMARCEDRQVSCPRGCRAAGLRARDVAPGGLHASRCRIQNLTCDSCQQSLLCPDDVRPEFVFEQHKSHCKGIPVGCDWCLGSHFRDRLGRASALCRTRLESRLAQFRGQPLVLHSKACGPVYVTRPGVDNPIFIRLSGEGLAHVIACHESVDNLTPRLDFVWNGMPCFLRLGYSPGGRGHGFSFQIMDRSRSLVEQRGNTKVWFAASLREDDGTLLEELGSVKKTRWEEKWQEMGAAIKRQRAQLPVASCDRPEPRIKLSHGYTEPTWIHSFNVLGSGDGAGRTFLLHLDTGSCRD